MASLDKTLRKLLTIETFQGVFDSDEFVENVTATTMEQMKGSAKDFDAKPFIRVFENSIDRLNQLSIQLTQHIIQLEDEDEQAERQHQDRSAALEQEFIELQKAFEVLETGITDVGATAIRVGEQLETVDKQKTRGAEAKELIKYFIEIVEGKKGGGVEGLEEARTKGPDGQMKVATITRRLLSIAKDVDLDEADTAVERIERYVEHLEQSLLHDFGQAYQAGEMEYVAVCSRVLYEFNGGSSCLQLYLNQHSFFLENAELVPPMDDLNPSVAKLPEWSRDPPAIDPILENLLGKIVDVVKSEWEIIVQVFPNSVAAMQSFTQRIFALTLQNYLEELVAKAQGTSSLRLLRVLTASHRGIAKCVADLKKFDEDAIQKSDAASSEAAPVSSSATVSVTVERCFEDLFAPYTEKEKYYRAESQVLLSVFEEILLNFHNYQRLRRLQIKRDNSIFGLMGVSQFASDEVEGEIVLVEEDGQLLAETTANILMVHAEAVGRCQELSTPSELTRNMRALFKLTVEYLKTRYVDIALEVAYDNSIRDEKKEAEPNLNILATIVAVDKTVKLIQRHFEQAVLPFVVHNPGLLREMIQEKNLMLTQLEHKVNGLVHRAVDITVQWISGLLTKQKKTDYKPRDSDFELLGMNTLACDSCVDYLRMVHKTAKMHMTGRNLEVGGEGRNLLIHLKKFVVNSMGGLIISKDISKYQETMDSWQIRIISDRFEMLKELGNIFMVRTDTIRSIISEGHLAKLQFEALKPFLMMREDWISSKLEKELQSAADDERSIKGNDLNF